MVSSTAAGRTKPERRHSIQNSAASGDFERDLATRDCARQTFDERLERRPSRERRRAAARPR